MCRLSRALIALLSISVFAAAKCYDPSPAFPVPQWSEAGLTIDDAAFDNLQKKLLAIVALPQYDIASASIGLTSSTSTLWSWHHSARQPHRSRGTDHVDGDSQYRVASITKSFTTLAILKLHAAGKLDINDPVNKYIPELAGKHSGKLPWKDITLRAMASQLSGIPREFGQSDFLADLEEPWRYGLPTESKSQLPSCYANKIPCSTDELLEHIQSYEPLYAPNQQSTYSNLNFELLGIVIETVSGQKYEEHIEEVILKPLNMTFSTFRKPSDEHAVFPDMENSWDDDLGALRPTGGLYSTTNDLSKFLRYVLTHYNALVTGVNWLLPASFSGLQSAYGMPWELFKSGDILQESKRAVTFVTKSGGLPGYITRIAALPEYNLGITILTAGPQDLLEKLNEAVTVEVVRAAEKAIWKSTDKKYTGIFVSDEPGLNSSVVVSTSAVNGIVLEKFISNGTDVLPLMSRDIFAPNKTDDSWHMQLIPTLLYKNESSQQGEIFRFVFTPERNKSEPEKIWDAFCSWDIDTPGTYAGSPINEVVYWHERDEVELTAFRVSLVRAKASSDVDEATLRVQPPL